MLLLLIALLAPSGPPPTIQLLNASGEAVTDARVMIGRVRATYDPKIFAYRAPLTVKLPHPIDVTHPRYRPIRKHAFGGTASLRLVAKGAPYSLQQNLPVAITAPKPGQMALAPIQGKPTRADIERQLGAVMTPGSLVEVPGCNPHWGPAISFWVFTPAEAEQARRCKASPAHGLFTSAPQPTILSRRIRVTFQPGVRWAQVTALIERHGLTEVSRYPQRPGSPPGEIVVESPNGCGLKVVAIAEAILRAPVVHTVNNELALFACNG